MHRKETAQKPALKTLVPVEPLSAGATGLRAGTVTPGHPRSLCPTPGAPEHPWGHPSALGTAPALVSPENWVSRRWPRFTTVWPQPQAPVSPLPARLCVVQGHQRPLPAAGPGCPLLDHTGGKRQGFKVDENRKKRACQVFLLTESNCLRLGVSSPFSEECGEPGPGRARRAHSEHWAHSQLLLGGDSPGIGAATDPWGCLSPGIDLYCSWEPSLSQGQLLLRALSS